MPTCSTCNDRRVIRHSPSPNTERVWIRCPACNPDPVSEPTQVSVEARGVDMDTSVLIDPKVRSRCTQCYGRGWIATNSGQEVRACPACIDSTEQLLTFRAICAMIMCADPTPLSRADDARVTTWADARANEYGYPSWEAAYHQIGKP